MAVYATVADMVLAYGEKALVDVADRDHDRAVEQEIIDGALAEASELVDGYLHDYLPITIVPSVRRATMAIAYELLHGGNQSTDDSRLGYERAVHWLKDIQAGKSELPGQPAGDDNVIDVGDPLVTSGERVWSRAIAGRLF